MKNYLVDNSIFLPDDISRLERGEIISKLLPANDERDVAVCGLVLIGASPEIGIKAFHDTMAKENRTSVIEHGNFSDPPKVEDLISMSLDDGDIEDLKTCRIGNCRVRLSASMIERFQREIDWTSENYSQRANKLFREMIHEYVQNYLKSGDAALIEYGDKRQSLRLQDDQRSLLEGLHWINEFAPGFLEYLKAFPKENLRNVRNSISWTKIKFGLKPVIVFTHTSKFTSEENGISQIMSVSKQIYASHYFDSSLGLTALVNFEKNRTGKGSYLFYTNHSRSASLGGVLSKYKHKVVDKEAIEKIEPLLRSTRTLAEFRSKNETAKANDTENREAPESSFSGFRLLAALGLAAVIAVAILIGKKALKT
ncbi:MAG: hypothetical protein R2681_01530 [Pyrinomonadaceae bacterium]